MDAMGTIIYFAAIIAVFYFLLIRPQKKREKAENQMRSSVDVGDSITTIGGIVGRVIAVKEDEDILVLETGADRLKLHLRRWAIRSKDTVIED